MIITYYIVWVMGSICMTNGSIVIGTLVIDYSVFLSYLDKLLYEIVIINLNVFRQMYKI